MNSRLVSNISSFHFAATEKNRHNLLTENISEGNIFVTGNPVVDALHSISKTLKPSRKIQQLIEACAQFIILIVNSAQITNGTLNVNETIQLAEKFLSRELHELHE